MCVSKIGAGLALALMMSSVPVQGQTLRGEAASLLLFPEYDNQSPGVSTLLTVTNTNDDPDDGSVLTEWIYVGSDCLELNRNELLTPGDTLTLLSGIHNPTATRGYLVVVAKHPVTGLAMPFDHLIGTSTLLDGFDQNGTTLEPFAFRAVGGDVDGDGRYRFDGLEYQAAPAELLIPRFLGQDVAQSVQSDLLLIDLTGGRDHTTAVDFLVYNDNEEVFSAQRTFSCWERFPLQGVSGLFGNAFLKSTAHDPFEIVGASQQEAGWLVVDGASTQPPVGAPIPDPAILALVVDRDPIGGAMQPFFRGTQENGGFPPEGFTDCNGNGVPDETDIADGTSPDCNGNGVPDECDPDGNGNGFPDECEPICPTGVTLALWPPNHAYHAIDLAAVAGVVDPLGGALTFAITSITQDEPVNGNGDGNTVCDGTGIGGAVAHIRSERQGGGNGRVYVVSYDVTNEAGIPCTGTFSVTVPKAQNGNPAVDDGQAFDSTEGCP